MNLHNRLLRVAAILIAIVAGGTIGYMVIEGWSFLDALYMTITTITTVGYDEVHPLSDAGRIFGIFLIVGGVGGALYTLTTVVGYFVEGQFGSTLGRRQMRNKIAGLKDHFIICGYGRVGQEVARAFAGDGMPFVVIDSSQESIAQAEKDGYPFLLANATEDEVLKEAGIEKARGLVSAVGGDVDNTYITLSARGLRPDLFIAVRASDREAEVKLARAGANRIVSPYSIGARRLAMLALRPAVVDFIDTVSYGPGRELKLENIAVSDNSPLAGTTVEATRQRTRVNILAISDKKGKLLANPAGKDTIEAGGRLIVIGTREQLCALEEGCLDG
jgi:voltage-gated potassium channel